MALQTSNNVKKIIAAPVLSTDLTIPLVDVIGLPNVSAPADWTVLTLIRLSDLQQEIVRVDDIVGNDLTVQRAQEGTIALDFVGFDECRNFFTAGMFQELQAIVTPPPPASETVAGIAEIATQAETDAGTDDERIVTPLKLKTLVDAVVVTPDATESVKGKAELATQAETDAGTDDERIVTPLKLATLIAGLQFNNPSRAIYKEIQPTGVDAGATINGANIRIMNTEVSDPDNIGTLDLLSGKVTLVAGTYLVEGSTVAFNPDGARLSFRDNSGHILEGTSGWASSGNTTTLTVTGVITSTGVEEYYMLMTVDNGVATHGKGRAASILGVPENYATLTFTKID